MPMCAVGTSNLTKPSVFALCAVLQAPSQRAAPRPRPTAATGTQPSKVGHGQAAGGPQTKGDVEEGSAAPPVFNLKKSSQAIRQNNTGCWGILMACLGGSSTAVASGKSGKRKLLPSIHTSVRTRQ
jgi:hypothetical protein